MPFTRSFGYTAAPQSAQTACNYQWTGGNRDNLVVSAAIDNGSNVYGPFAGLIANTVVFLASPWADWLTGVGIDVAGGIYMG